MKKQIRLLYAVVIFLVASNAVTLFTSIFFLSKLDERYDSEMKPAVPVFQSFQRLAQETANLHRALLNSLMAETASEKNLQLDRIVLKAASTRIYVDQISAEISEKVPASFIKEFKQTATTYVVTAERMHELVASGRVDEARGLRISHLRPAFDAYQGIQALLVEELGQNFSDARADLKASVDSTRRGIITVGTIPILVGVLLVIGFIVFLFVMLRVFMLLNSSES